MPFEICDKAQSLIAMVGCRLRLELWSTTLYLRNANRNRNTRSDSYYAHSNVYSRSIICSAYLNCPSVPQHFVQSYLNNKSFNSLVRTSRIQIQCTINLWNINPRNGTLLNIQGLLRLKFHPE